MAVITDHLEFQLLISQTILGKPNIVRDGPGKFPGGRVIDADAAVTAVIDVITESLKQGEKVQLVGFGTFEVRERGARTGRDPRTNQEIQIPASKAPAFKAGKALKDTVNGK